MTDPLVIALPDSLREILTVPRVNAAKGGLAALGAVWLLIEIGLRRAGRPDAQRGLRDALLAALGVAAALAWTNFLQFRQTAAPGPLWHVHKWDTFHYFVGARYFRELGYTRLYDCVLVAELEHVPAGELARRPYRNLVTSRLESPAALLAEPERCTRHFSPERWRAFARDVRWFRRRTGGFEAITQDWGYNPTPVWALAGIPLAEAAPASIDRIRWLTALDLPLLLLAFGSLAWAFGWRAPCIALVFFGTSAPSDYRWTGGSFLRMGWIATASLGVALLRRGWPLPAGVFLCGSALLRIFPGLALVALAVGALLDARRERTLRRFHRRVAAGAILGAGVLLPLSAVVPGGPGAWLEFARNSVADSRPARNSMGLKNVFTYRHDARAAALRERGVSDPDAWETARRGALAERRWAFALAVVACLLPLLLALDREPDWLRAVLGIAAMAVLFQLPAYYQAALFLLGLLWPRHPEVGVALCAFAAFSRFASASFEPDVVYTWVSLGSVLCVLFAAGAVLRARRLASRA